MTAFVQADVPPSFARSLRCLRDNITYTPLRNKDRTPYFMKRCDIWDKPLTQGPRNCFHSYKIFGWTPRYTHRVRDSTFRTILPLAGRPSTAIVHTWRRALTKF